MFTKPQMMLASLFLVLPLSLRAFALSTPHHGARDCSAISSVGIALTLEYATLSIRLDNGTFTDVGSVDGDEAYEDVMRRLIHDG
jgi:hypothetical protein